MKFKYGNSTYDIPSDFLSNCMKRGMSKMEGVQLWLTDNGIVKNQEQEELHEKAKTVKVDHGVKPKSETKSNTTRKREPDTDKRFLVNSLKEMLENAENVKNIDVSNVEREISFTYNGNEYSFTLTKHRNK